MLKKLNDAIIFSKIYLNNYELNNFYKNKIIKKNKIISNLQKTNYKLKNEINELLQFKKYSTINI